MMEAKLKILIIEDDTYISNFISVSLKRSGYSILNAESAAEGMLLFASHSPDIILLDLVCPTGTDWR
jgi:two-component system KDP operon response regulator KdpE